MAYTKNYYQILNLTWPSSNQPHTQAPSFSPADIRRAYKLALLSAHPDKTCAPTAKSTTNEEGKPHTVDDVKEAYRVLSDEKQRAAYETWFMRCGGREEKSGAKDEFVLGLEVLDLSDFSVGVGRDGEQEVWTRGCRCGNEEGFRILEGELEGALRRGEKEVLVGCAGCSLWVRVGFEVEDEEG